MNKRFLVATVFIAIPFLTVGCDTGTDTIQVHDIIEFKWQGDGTAIFGLEQKYATTATSVQPSIGYTLSRFNSDGTLAQTYDVSPKSRPDFSYCLYISGDGTTAVTQLESDLYRFNTKTGLLEKLQTQVDLITVSPDLHYAVGTPSPNNQPIKTVNVYDISSATARLVSHFDIALINTCGVWLNNSTFGITVKDSVGSHISIYDTLASLKTIIGGAETQFHNFVFNPQTNHIFIRNFANKSSDYFVDKIDLATLARQNVLNVKVENFDVTKDENIVVYSAFDAAHSIFMKSRNLTSSNEISIGTDILRIISISPQEDKLAYIRGNTDQNEIHVIPFSRP